MDGVKVLAFDTGGTILDWHGGIVAALETQGVADAHAVAGEYRRRALRRMLGQIDPGFTIDDVHRAVLDELLPEIPPAGREAVAARWHALDAWPDFVPALARMRRHYPCVSFTILSLALVVAVSRRNGIAWDAVIACEMLRVYKTRAEAYRRTAQLLQVRPSEIVMVACHNFDLDAARAEGYRTAFVRRPAEWGPGGPPDPHPNPACDLVVDDFAALADRLGA